MAEPAYEYPQGRWFGNSIGGHRELTEPEWAIHSQAANWSDDDGDMLATDQQMLRDYGPTLVEEGLLSK
ncbi:MAG: hypothetical protein KDA60_18555 [Planctomycetales bacterium]|nr:hypothetical protein [Planctomycetales bacterium]